jgi:hypothetical protein
MFTVTDNMESSNGSVWPSHVAARVGSVQGDARGVCMSKFKQSSLAETPGSWACRDVVCASMG